MQSHTRLNSPLVCRTSHSDPLSEGSATNRSCRASFKVGWQQIGNLVNFNCKRICYPALRVILFSSYVVLFHTKPVFGSQVSHHTWGTLGCFQVSGKYCLTFVKRRKDSGEGGNTSDLRHFLRPHCFRRKHRGLNRFSAFLSHWDII